MLSIHPRLLIVLLTLVSLGFVGCDSGTHESADPPVGDVANGAANGLHDDVPDPAADANAVVGQMLTLAQAGEWEQFIDEYYGEAAKIPGDAQKQSLIDRFANGWGEKLIPVLEQASEIMPDLEDDKALFRVDGETIYTLHLDNEGKWGFHL